MQLTLPKRPSFIGQVLTMDTVSLTPSILVWHPHSPVLRRPLTTQSANVGQMPVNQAPVFKHPWLGGSSSPCLGRTLASQTQDLKPIEQERCITNMVMDDVRFKAASFRR